MSESTKYTPVNNGTTTTTTIVSDFKLTNIFTFRTKRTRTFAYIFISIFIAVTVFLAFNPSQNPTSPWFSSIFTSSSFKFPNNSTTPQAHSTNITNSYTSFNSSGVRSQFSSIYSYFFPSNSTSTSNITLPGSANINNNNISNNNNNNNNKFNNNNNNYNNAPTVDNKQNGTATTSFQSGAKEKNQTATVVHGGVKNGTVGLGKNEGIGDLVKKLLNCELFDGDWVRDETYPLYKPGSCSLIDEQFNCFVNGRPDNGFQMLKWKPKACTLPRLDGKHMLELLRGKRLVFVGDSLNRNMWESLVCILRNSVKDQTKVYEASGKHHFRSEPSYSFVFKDYNCTVEFFVAPFIVRESETKDKNGTKIETLRLDLIGNSAHLYKTADFVVFNTGHWWTHEKTAKGKDYYQEGSHIYNELNVLEAFRKAMTTWGRWVDANINPSKTLVFFRGYSASHFRGGRWNSGGQCDNEEEPIKNTTYLAPYPDKMMVLEKVLRGMKTRVSYLNITRLTDFRKDGHPSIYRKKHYSEVERRSPLHFQDCSHWCLPGVPDSWNEILYAELLAKQYQNQRQKN